MENVEFDESSRIEELHTLTARAEREQAKPSFMTRFYMSFGLSESHTRIAMIVTTIICFLLAIGIVVKTFILHL